LVHHADPNILSAQKYNTPRDITPLHFALLMGDIRKVELLIHASARTDIPSKSLKGTAKELAEKWPDAKTKMRLASLGLLGTLSSVPSTVAGATIRVRKESEDASEVVSGYLEAVDDIAGEIASSMLFSLFCLTYFFRSQPCLF